jgi:hypothetical protein
MLFFGDRSRLALTAEEVAELRRGSAALNAMPAGLERHSAAVALFIRAAELAQGVADADFEAVGEDRPTPATAGAERILRAFAALVVRSWRGGFEASAVGVEPFLREAPEAVRCRRQEGYAFYGVYPEAYITAASALAGQRPTVVGVRSIGLGLGAAVACASGAPCFLSVRPIGHPFHRRLALSADAEALLRRRRDAAFAIVDEGPGLSGSSFVAVAEALQSLGVSPAEMRFFPSHEGDPACADAAVRARWAAARRHVAGFDCVQPHLSDWCSDLTGPALAPLEDIGGGRWRRHRPPPANEAPVQPMRERRKYLLESEAGVFVLRFAGLGDYGAQAFARARILAEAGFSPPVLGLRHGFLVERWLADSAPLRLDRGRVEIIERIVDYLAFRAHRLAASPESGASLSELADMLAVNAREGSGLRIDAAAWRRRALTLEPLVTRVQTDNRLHWWEWLRTTDGSILKADAYDHCAGHDLVGCQDIAWDVVGACVEFELSAQEQERLCEGLRARRTRVEPDLLAFLLPCYLAFQLGASHDPWAAGADAERSKSAARRYGLRLKSLLLQ